MSELLSAPLGMKEIAFFLADGEPRIDRVPKLCGAVIVANGARAEVRGERDC